MGQGIWSYDTCSLFSFNASVTGWGKMAPSLSRLPVQSMIYIPYI